MQRLSVKYLYICPLSAFNVSGHTQGIWKRCGHLLAEITNHVAKYQSLNKFVNRVDASDYYII